MSMESASFSEQPPVTHAGFYETASFETIRTALHPGDEFLLKTESGSQYSFLITLIEGNDPYHPFAATGVLLDAPAHATEGKEPLLRLRQEYTFSLAQDRTPLLIFTSEQKLSPSTFQAIPMVTTSPVTSYGIRSAN